jgi:hypothetical protein
MLRNIPTKEGGINTQRVEQFLDENNLRRSEYFVVNQRDLPYALYITSCLIRQNNKYTVLGFYEPALDVVILLHDAIEKAGIPQVVQESILVHELTHSSGGTDSFVRPRRSPKGYTKDGIFLEEGFCDLMQSKYFAKHGSMHSVPSKGKADFHTFNSVCFTNLEATESYEGNTVYYDSKRTWMAGPSAYAGFGIELLSRAIPNLVGSLVNARSNPLLFTNALLLIDKYFPGLSQQLMELQNNTADYAKGNALIIEAIFGQNSVKVNSRAEPIVQDVTSIRYRIRKILGL